MYNSVSIIPTLIIVAATIVAVCLLV